MPFPHLDNRRRISSSATADLQAATNGSYFVCVQSTNNAIHQETSKPAPGLHTQHLSPASTSLGLGIELSKKRKSRGRSKGGKGSAVMIQCSHCGRPVPRDKAKRETRWTSLVDPSLARELRSQGTYIARERVVKFYCVSCAVHFGLTKVRSEDERRYY